MKQTRILKSLILLLSITGGIHAQAQASEAVYQQNDYYVFAASQDWTDNAVISTSTDNDVAAIVDNNLETHAILGSFEQGMWIMAEMNEPMKLTGYSVSSGATIANAPRAWKLQGSNDKSAWTDINSQDNVNLANNGETKLVKINMPSDRNSIKAYKYYRLLINENNGGNELELSEWQLYGFPEQLHSHYSKRRNHHRRICRFCKRRSRKRYRPFNNEKVLCQHALNGLD